jgi:hypothetical protein
MATHASANQDSPRTQSQPLVPPEEQFWVRYSPHAELPLSGVGSFAVHLLVFGLLLLIAFPLAAYFSRSARSVPVEAVRLDLGGGGGKPGGVGDGPGVASAPIEAGTQTDEKKEAGPVEPIEKPDLTLPRGPIQAPRIDDDPAARVVARGTSDPLAAFKALRETNSKMRLGEARQPGAGQGGSGSGGGQGTGQGTGTGAGTGAGKGKLTQREKRMLRWSMLFNTSNARDYLDQLQGLGAILAIPVKESPTGREYRLVYDLSRRPAELKNDDISKIQRIYWIDDKPQSVLDVMSVLGVQLPQPPSHFVAFMPEALEEKLFDLEKKYKGLPEDQILETKFRIKRTAGGFEPEVISQTRVSGR